mgnify:CR=1 FL=1
MENTKNTKRSIRIPNEINRKIKEEAERKQVSVNKLIICMLRKRYSEDGSKRE